MLDCPTTFSTSQTDGKRLYLNYTKDPGKWIYCNFPEDLTSTAVLGDRQYGNHFLNQVVINGTAQLFASHVNHIPNTNIYFGVQLYNPTGSTISVTKQNNGFRYSSSDWLSVECGVWNDFFSNPGGTVYTVGSGKSLWIMEQYVPYNSFFNAVLRFQTSGIMYCFVYVYKSRSNIDGTATLFPWDTSSRVYRGYGDSYFIRSTINLNVSQMPYYYYTSTCTAGNTNEVISITEPSNGTIYSCPGANLGNWGIQNYYTVNLHNDTSSSKTIRAYIGSDNTSCSAPSVVNLGGTVKYCCPTQGNQWWNWLIDTIGANSTQTYTYQYIHAANASGPTLHGWRLG